MSTATLTQTDIAFAQPTTPPISVNPARMSGQSVIGTSRVPIGVLLDYIDREALLRDFPSLNAEVIEQAIQYLKEKGEEGTIGELVDY